uniref:Uncharacterized protein n=1 Tax=Cacopsylla melanoneura TaxID=428564 RepID=A0A8D8WNH9_9HEMI
MLTLKGRSKLSFIGIESDRVVAIWFQGISFNILRWPTRFPGFSSFVVLNLRAFCIASFFTCKCNGSRSSITSKAALGAVRIAPVMLRQANRWILVSSAWAVFCSVFGHHTKEAYVTRGLMIAKYDQWIICGFSPHVFPNSLRQTQIAAVAFLDNFSRCLFHVSLLSRITPRYLTSLESSTTVPSSFGAFIFSFSFLVKGTMVILLGLILSPFVLHHLETMFKAFCMRSDKTSSYLPLMISAISSA